MANPENELISLIVLIIGLFLLGTGAQYFSDPAKRAKPAQVLKATLFLITSLFIIGLWMVWIRKDPNSVLVSAGPASLAIGNNLKYE
jgi:hypothetical protein